MNDIKSIIGILDSQKTREEKLTLNLNSRDDVEVSQMDSPYTETVIKENNQIDKRGIGNYGLGSFLKFSELKESGRDRKIVYLKTFYTQTNKFREDTKDVVYTFVDREGFEFQSYAFSSLDTSNQVSKVKELNELIGNAIILDFHTVVKGDRVYIEPIDVYKCKNLHGKKEEVLMFFKSEVLNKAKFINEINNNIVRYPSAKRVWEDNYNYLIEVNIEGLLNRRGEYSKFFSKLIKNVDILDLELEEKEAILLISLAKILKTQKSKFKSLEINIEDENLLNFLYDEIIYGNSKSEPEICGLTLNILEDLIYTQMLVEDSKSYLLNKFFHKPSKQYVQIRREEN